MTLQFLSHSLVVLSLLVGRNEQPSVPPSLPRLKQFLERHEKLAADSKAFMKGNVARMIAGLESKLDELRQRKAQGESVDTLIEKYEKHLARAKELQKKINSSP
jgi:hypothetical protein